MKLLYFLIKVKKMNIKTIVNYSLYQIIRIIIHDFID